MNDLDDLRRSGQHLPRLFCEVSYSTYSILNIHMREIRLVATYQ